TATGTGAWEASLVNTLSPGDKVLMVETGQFATQWKNMAQKLGLVPEFIKTDWRIGADPAVIEARLKEDKKHEIKAVCVLHNDTAPGSLPPTAEIRKAIARANHPRLLMVVTTSSLASTDYRHDEWGVDVTIGGAQKGLMLPPGMSFNAVSDKALGAAKTSRLPKSFWSWEDMLATNRQDYFPYTPATQMLQGLATSIDMLHEEGLENVFARHDRLAEATRVAVRAWGLEIMCRDPKYYSPTITAVLMPEGHDADAFRNLALDTFNISYGMSFGTYAGKMFRIGHLGDINDLTLIGALGGTEMALALARVPHRKGGVQAAMDYLVTATAAPARVAAEGNAPGPGPAPREVCSRRRPSATSTRSWPCSSACCRSAAWSWKLPAVPASTSPISLMGFPPWNGSRPIPITRCTSRSHAGSSTTDWPMC